MKNTMKKITTCLLLAWATLALPATAQVHYSFFGPDPTLSIRGSAASLGWNGFIDSFQDGILPVSHTLEASIVDATGSVLVHSQMGITSEGLHLFGGSETQVHIIGDPEAYQGIYGANFRLGWYVYEPLTFTMSISTGFTSGVLDYVVFDYGTGYAFGYQGGNPDPANGTVTGTFLPGNAYSLRHSNEGAGGASTSNPHDVGGTSSFDLQMSTVPEPSSLALLLASAFAFIATTNRRRNVA